MSCETTDRLSACLECARVQPLDNGQCAVEDCSGLVAYVDNDHPAPFTDTEMDLFRRLADRLSAGRIKGDVSPGVRKIAAGALTGQGVTLTALECSDLVEVLAGMVDVPRDGDEVRWWADLRAEAEEAASQGRQG